mmetsp:Transcript_69662/g.145256  ORF Transcript_69662/g.145256 Transcript_69662/m.145256 type:complete len:105 (+) Transcript_69662:193-507(+)
MHGVRMRVHACKLSAFLSPALLHVNPSSSMHMQHCISEDKCSERVLEGAVCSVRLCETSHWRRNMSLVATHSQTGGNDLNRATHAKGSAQCICSSNGPPAFPAL